MICTVTFNPAVDYVVGVKERLSNGSVNRAVSEEVFFGGKGINVSLVLAELGMSSKVLGFVAGFTGAAIEQGISERGKGILTADFIHLEQGFSRINVKIRADDGSESELNGQGPDIPEKALGKLFKKLEKLCDGDTLVLAGSIPRSISADIYEKILVLISQKNIRTVVDASGKLLLNVLKYKPFLVKPNIHELSETFNADIKTDSDVILYANKLREAGAQNVLVSMAGDGSILVDEYGDIHRCGVCSGTVVNSVGAGDSMVAGFLAGYSQSGDYDHALKLGTAAGGATAFSKGLAERDKIYELLGQLNDL